MKKNFYRNLACMLIFTGGLCIATSTKAQVTVGSKGVPNAGALLDMKQKDKTDGSANSDKGLGLPRVALSAVDKLDPCVATTGNTTKDDTAKKSHIGLTVYNTTDNTSTDATLIEGVYAWDGTMWTQYSGSPAGGAENGLSMNGRKVILGGALNQPTTITGDATNNLTLNTPTKVGSTLGVTGATTLASTLGVTGVTTLADDLTMGTPTVTKLAKMWGDLYVSGETKTTTSSVSGNETVGGTLKVTGKVGIGTTAPNANLDIRPNPTSTNNPGVSFFGVGTTAATPAAAGAGAIRYSTLSGGVLEYSNGVTWNTLESTVQKLIVTAYKVSAQSIATVDGGVDVIDWKLETEVTPYFNAATGVFTAPRNGNYTISFSFVSLPVAVPAGSQVESIVVLNSQPQAGAKKTVLAFPVAGTVQAGSTLSFTFKLKAGNTLTPRVWHNLGKDLVLRVNQGFVNLSIVEL